MTAKAGGWKPHLSHQRPVGSWRASWCPLCAGPCAGVLDAKTGLDQKSILVGPKNGRNELANLLLTLPKAPFLIGKGAFIYMTNDEP